MLNLKQLNSSVGRMQLKQMKVNARFKTKLVDLKERTLTLEKARNAQIKINTKLLKSPKKKSFWSLLVNKIK